MSQAISPPPSAGPLKSWVLLEAYEGRNNGKTRLFKKGETIVGFLFTPQLPPNATTFARVMPQVNSDGYIIPYTIVKEVPTVQVDKGNEIVGQTKQIIKTSGFKQGATIGIILGAGYGFFNNRSVFFSAMLGMLGGGLIGHMMFSKEKPKK